MIALDQEGVARAVGNLAAQIEADLTPQRTAIVGIRSLGDEVARRVVDLLEKKGCQFEFGVLDISLYRDDFAHRKTSPKLQSSEIPFQIDGARVILIDDVLFTGRTIRAALDAVFDYGRPDSVKLGVLIDRGHRELPVQPDYVGTFLETDREHRVDVQLNGADQVLLQTL